MTVVSINPSDLDDVETVPAAKALGNLRDVHGLPELAGVCVAHREDGATVVVAAVVGEAAAELWRAALAAPKFSERRYPTSSQHITEVIWFGALVRLSFSTY